MIHILDASAMLAYLKSEPGGDVVNALLQNPAESCYAHIINLCEVYYDFIRQSDEKMAREVIKDLFSDGIIERKDTSRRFWFRVGQLKARGRISLADCFCIALAQELSGQVVTSDHKEFDPLVPLDLCPIRFIR